MNRVYPFLFCRLCIGICIGIWALLAAAPSLADALKHLTVPKGFAIEIYAEVENPRQLAQSPSGIVYAGSRKAGKVHALLATADSAAKSATESATESFKDAPPKTDKETGNKRVLTLADNLNLPSGIALFEGDLYIADIDTIYRIKNADQAVAALEQSGKQPKLEVFYRGFPSDKHHGWKYLRAYTDDQGRGQLIVPVGAPCNICDKGLPYASLWRLDLDSKQKYVIAQGVRNSVGFDFHPTTGDLWFTDNGRDHMGDQLPSDELNYLLKQELTGHSSASKQTSGVPHYGYPYVHGRDTKDPEFSAPANSTQNFRPTFRPTRHEIPAHFAPLGMSFYTGSAFPEKHHNSIFIAEHGSWNRSVPGGYRITQVVLGKANLALDYRVIVDGFLELSLKKGGTPKDFTSKVYGRPADVVVANDGALLISDDHANMIYRLSTQ